MGMKTVLCYGDSNTWGYNPGGEERFGRDIRWPALLDVALGEAVHVAEEGLCGRTATWEDQTWDNRNGRTFFPVALETHAPIDLVVIMLGTNELKSAFNLSAADIANGVSTLAEMALSVEGAVPAVLLVAPAHCSKEIYELRDTFVGGVEKSQKIASYLERRASELGCHFFDASTVAKVDPIDGLHLNAKNHEMLAQALTPLVRDILA